MILPAANSMWNIFPVLFIIFFLSFIFSTNLTVQKKLIFFYIRLCVCFFASHSRCFISFSVFSSSSLLLIQGQRKQLCLMSYRAIAWMSHTKKKNRTHFQCEKLNIQKREKKWTFVLHLGSSTDFIFSNLFHISFIFECFVCTAKFQLLLRSTVMLFTLVFQNVFIYCAACHPADSSTERQTNKQYITSLVCVFTYARHIEHSL